MNVPTARRNDPCPCGSGLRYKECHGRLDPAAPQPAAPLPAEESFRRGLLAFRAQRPQEALALFDAALALEPGHAFALHFKGYALCQLARFDEGVPLLERSLQMQPRHADVQANTGSIRYVLGDLPGAIAALERAIELAPGVPEPYSNLALALRDSGDPDRALTAVRRALQLKPDLATARFNFAMILLALGRFAEAWPAYNWRPNPAVNLRDLGLPARWPHAAELPDLAKDPWITLHGEQGPGDVLFFMRYAQALRARGAKLRFWGDARLAPMLLRNGVVDEAIAATEVPPGLDTARLVWLGDLPAMLHLENDFPAPARLAPQPARVEAMRARLAALGPVPYVAVTWRAGTERRGKAVLSKAIEPAALGAALRGLRATFVSVQRNPGADESAVFEGSLGARIADFSALNNQLDDMLALMGVVDEYVGVSNTNTHLRAGTGRSARLLLPWPAEWRWMRSGEASPWFPGYCLYRATREGDWGPTLARLRADLEAVSR